MTRLIHSLASPSRETVTCNSRIREEESSHMQISSFVPEVTAGVVGFCWSCRCHRALRVSVSAHACGRHTSCPRSARLLRSQNQGCGKHSHGMTSGSCLLLAQDFPRSACHLKRTLAGLQAGPRTVAAPGVSREGQGRLELLGTQAVYGNA